MYFSKNFILLYFIIIFFNNNFCLSMDIDYLGNLSNEQLITPIKKKPRPNHHNKENIPPKIKEKIHNLQTAYIENDPTSLSPASKQHFTALTTSLTGPIKNPNILATIQNQEVFYSPFVRRIFNRRQIEMYKKSGLIISLPANAYTEYVELPPETKEEKEARKKRDLEYFQSLNSINYLIFNNLQEREAAYWVPYWNFIKIEKEKVEKGQRKKLRPEELEDIAKITALRHYQSFDIAGTTFYYHPDFLDLTIKDELGRTNTERMKKNLNPRGRDGLAMEVHHLTMFDDSILVLLSRTLHEGGSLKKATQDDLATFHPQPSYYGRTRGSDIDRTRFGQIVKEIFQKLIKLSNTTTPLSLDQTMPVDDDELECLFAIEEKPDHSGFQFVENTKITLELLSPSLQDQKTKLSTLQPRKQATKRKLLFDFGKKEETDDRESQFPKNRKASLKFL